MYLERARALLKADPVPVERIEAGLLEAIDQHGPVVTFLELLIDLNIDTKNYRKAIAWIDRLPGGLKNSPAWLIKTAEIEELLENRGGALKLYWAVIDHCPVTSGRYRRWWRFVKKLNSRYAGCGPDRYRSLPALVKPIF